MIVGKQNIISWFESLKVPYWDLFVKGQTGGSPICRSSKDADLTITDSLDSLKRALDIQNRGQFTLFAQDTQKITAKGGFKADFEIPASEASAAPAAQAMPVMSGMPQTLDDLDRVTESRAGRMVEKVRLEMKLEKLQDKIADLEKEKKDLEKIADKGSNRFWEAINGIGVDNILKAFLVPKQPAPQPQVSGIADVAEPPETDTDYSARLGRVIQIFQENDDDWLGTLEKMANKIQSDPSVIKMFKKFL